MSAFLYCTVKGRKLREDPTPFLPRLEPVEQTYHALDRHNRALLLRNCAGNNSAALGPTPNCWDRGWRDSSLLATPAPRTHNAALREAALRAPPSARSCAHESTLLKRCLVAAAENPASSKAGS
eukprot:CAMPEP_0179154532 /NCGR_PEP_ID=MMETSP0796-20121207/75217_1 /TAXON_ID=73915 /ORGANISM="Pyrodinium bahamense, Strain pbaha01" /LENGTH=123 /DNA_ID=CAMNT_0020855923 /DNA_START=29 /DNA_END=400 /DNA_ORIENTATION=+